MSVPAWAAHLPAGMQGRELDLSGAGSLPARWLQRWAEDPGAAVVWHGATGWTRAGELEERSRRVASRLAATGVAAGDRVLVSAAPSRELVVALVALWRLGAVVVPVNTGYTEREFAHVLADAAPAAAIVDDAVRAAWLRGRELAPRLVCSPDVDPADGDPTELDRCGPADPALICYTSGTSGAPKGAVLTHANVLASIEALRIAWRWTPEDRLVLALPLYHLHGLGVGLIGSLAAGASCVLLDRFDAGELLDAAATHGASLFFGVPTMYARIVRSGRGGELSRLRLCVSGSAPLPADLFDAVAAASGAPVLERYGMTETMMLISNPCAGERRRGSVGLPLPGVQVRLAGADTIEVRGPNVFAGYWRRPEISEALFSADGWFRTGDVGAVDADGYWRIVGRRSDLVISGGYNVYPREVEEVLLGDPAVADVAVVGVPDPDLGEEVVAVVVAAGNTTADSAAAILDRAGTGLARYKLPRRIVFVESLPRNSMGKVLRHELVSELT